MIPRLNPGCFTWQEWRGGCLLDLGIKVNRRERIIDNKAILNKYAIGCCPSEQIPCRLKIGCVAVMFQKDNILFWTHLLEDEFEKVFGETR